MCLMKRLSDMTLAEAAGEFWSEESRCGGPGAPWDSLKAWGG